MIASLKPSSIADFIALSEFFPMFAFAAVSASSVLAARASASEALSTARVSSNAVSFNKPNVATAVEASTAVLTVVISTRNSVRALPEAIDSVVAQGVVNLEIIVTDDGSTDGTRAWLRRRQETLPGLRVLTGDGDGPNMARNRAIIAARAPLIAFLDAHDRWTPGKLTAQHDFHLKRPDVVFSFTNYVKVDAEERPLGACFDQWNGMRRLTEAAERAAGRVEERSHLRQPPFCSIDQRPRSGVVSDSDGAVFSLGRRGGYCLLELAEARLLAENVVGGSTVVVRRQDLLRVGGFDVSMRSVADWDLWLRLSRLGHVGFTSFVGAVDAPKPDPVGNDVDLRIEYMRRIITRHAPFLAVSGSWALRCAEARLLLAEAELARSRGLRWRAFRAHLKAFLKSRGRRAAQDMLVDLSGLWPRSSTQSPGPWFPAGA
ncbi:hypothetical protein CCP2SC5_30010 [Azospirillaceae bacterium]